MWDMFLQGPDNKLLIWIKIHHMGRLKGLKRWPEAGRSVRQICAQQVL
jgi:hypothetical protein